MELLEELLKQENLEKGIKDILDNVFQDIGRVNSVLMPEFIKCSETDKTITIEFPVLEWELNSNNVMHGGIIAAAFDEALGIFANYLSKGRPAVSSNLAVNYLKPVPQGDCFVVTAKLTSCGKRLITLTGEGRLKSNNKLSDTCMVTYTIL